MPTTRAQRLRSRHQSKQHACKLSDNTRSRENLRKGRSCTRSGRQYCSVDTVDAVGRKSRPAEERKPRIIENGKPNRSKSHTTKQLLRKEISERKGRSCTRSGRQYCSVDTVDAVGKKSRPGEERKPRIIECGKPNRSKPYTTKQLLRKEISELFGRPCTRSGRQYCSVDTEDVAVGRKSRPVEERRPRMIKFRKPNCSKSRTTKKLLRKELSEQLRERIASIHIKGRPVPDTDDLKILGVELKIRLAAISDVITEYGRRGGKVHVSTMTGGNRFVPLWNINRQQDPSLLCEVKVKVINARRRKHK